MKFGQGSFQIDPNLTPEEIRARREKLARSAPRYGSARYIGEGLAHLGTGIADMIASRRLNKAEREGREGAEATMGGLTGGGIQFPFGGETPAPGPNQGIADDAMLATGNQPRGRDEFISAMWPHANRVSQETGLDPRLIIAQSAQETGWGKSAPGNNYFGIKSHGKSGGNVMQTKEVIGGQTVQIPQSFRGYESMGDSVSGYAEFLKENPRYTEMLSAGDLDGQLDALGKSGYATDPNYARSVGSIAQSIQPPAQQNAQSDMSPLYEALNNPWLTQQQRSTVQRMIAEQEQANDPLRQLQLEKTQLEVQKMREPEPGYRVLSKEESAQMGLSEGEAYQIGPDQKISKVGGGGVTVNTGSNGQRMGVIPQGYTVVEDPNSDAGYRMVAIPGGPEDTSGNDEKRLSNAAIASEVITTAATRAREAVSKQDMGAAGTSIVGMLPWTDSAEVVRQVDVLKAQAAGSNLQAMRDASPTGGALGNVTEGELKLLENKSGSLNPNSPTFLRDLEDYERTLLRTVHGRVAGDEIFDATRSEDGVPQFNPQTGEWE